MIIFDTFYSMGALHAEWRSRDQRLPFRLSCWGSSTTHTVAWRVEFTHHYVTQLSKPTFTTFTLIGGEAETMDEAQKAARTALGDWISRLSQAYVEAARGVLEEAPQDACR